MEHGGTPDLDCKCLQAEQVQQGVTDLAFLIGVMDVHGAVDAAERVNCVEEHLRIGSLQGVWE